MLSLFLREKFYIFFYYSTNILIYKNGQGLTKKFPAFLQMSKMRLDLIKKQIIFKYRWRVAGSPPEKWESIMVTGGFVFSAARVVWGPEAYSPSGNILIWKLLYISLIVTNRANLYSLFALVHFIFSDIVKYLIFNDFTEASWHLEKHHGNYWSIRVKGQSVMIPRSFTSLFQILRCMM